MKNIYKVILSLVVIINCSGNVIASSSDEESSTNNDSIIFNSPDTNIYRVLTEQEYINEVIPDINDVLSIFLHVKINISNVIHAAHNCNALGWDAYDNEFQKLINKDKNKFIEILKRNNIEIHNTNDKFSIIFTKLLDELKNSFFNNPDVFDSILKSIENISKDNLNIMQNNKRYTVNK